MMPFDWILQAAERISPHIRKTPVSFDKEHGWYMKWESHQVTGSFKVRGALNKVLSLETWERAAGLVTASAGNHGQGLALAGNLFNAPVTVFASRQAVSTKIEAMRGLGAEILFVEGGYAEAEAAAITYAAKKQMTWISAYNDMHVIAGQGTISIELANQLEMDKIQSIVVPAGGGGLVSGISVAIKHNFPDTKVVAVQSVASPFLHALYHHGTQDSVMEEPSLADGLAGAVENGSVTVPLVRSYVDDVILVTEEDIARAIALAWHKYKEKIEGSAAVGLAAVMNGRVALPAVVVISGGNIQPESHAHICSHYQEQI